MMGPLPTLVGPQLGLLLLPSPPIIPSHAWVLILCVLIAVASLHSVCCLLVTHSASMSSQWLTLMLSQGYAIFQPQSCFISLHMLHPQMSLSQLWDVWEAMLLLARPRGPQAMHRALMLSQWLTLMLS